MFSAQRLDCLFTYNDLQILGKTYYVRFDCESQENGKIITIDNVALSQHPNDRFEIRQDDFLYESIKSFIIEDCGKSPVFLKKVKDAFNSAEEE